MKAGGSVKDNKDIMAMVGKVDSGATVWVAAIIPPEAAGMMGGMGKPPKAAYLNLNVSSGLSAKVGLQFESADDAKAMSTMAEMGISALKGQAGPMKDMVESIKLDTKGDTLVVSGKLTGEQLDSLAQMGGGLPF
jgi:hypothetical protein